METVASRASLCTLRETLSGVVTELAAKSAAPRGLRPALSDAQQECLQRRHLSRRRPFVGMFGKAGNVGKIGEELLVARRQ